MSAGAASSISPEDHRCPLPRRPREEYHALRSHPGVPRGIRDQAALAIDSARYAESAEKARLDRDLRIAADIQRALLPEPAFDAGIADLAAASIPCRTVGGDFFDYIDVGERGFGFAWATWPARASCGAARGGGAEQFRGARAGQRPADAMTRINKALLRRAIEARFATMFYGAITVDGKLSYSQRRTGAAAGRPG